MKRAGAWNVERPPGEAFERMGAFGTRTMAFEQWLRWVFVPSVEARLAAGGPWPEESHVAAQAAREGDGAPALASLVPALAAFDGLFPEATPSPQSRAQAHCRSPARLAYDRSWACFEAGDFEGAREAIEACLAADDSFPNAHNFAGWVRLRNPRRGGDDLAAALAHFRAALVVAPEGLVLGNVAETLLTLGRVDDARRIMERALEAPSLAASAANWLAWFHAERQPDGALAVKHARRAVELRPAWGVARLNLGRACDRAAEALPAYQAYLDALACGDAHDEAHAERRMLALARELGGRGAPAVPASEGPAHDRLAGLDATLRALVSALGAEHPGLHLFGGAGEPVPEGDVPFGWVGTIADGRMHLHALVTELSTFAPVEVLVRGPKGLVLRSIQVRGNDVREAAAVVSAWIRAESPLPPERLTPLDAAVVAHGSLFEALPGWRLRVAGRADYDAPDEPARVTLSQRRFPGDLSISFVARPEGGVTARGMREAVQGSAPAWVLPTYDDLLRALPEMVLASGRALDALVAFRNRPLPMAAAVSLLLARLREAGLDGTAEAVVNDDTYPWSWPSASVRLLEGAAKREVVVLTESAHGLRLQVGSEVFAAASVSELQAAMAAIVEAARRGKRASPASA